LYEPSRSLCQSKKEQHRLNERRKLDIKLTPSLKQINNWFINARRRLPGREARDRNNRPSRSRGSSASRSEVDLESNDEGTSVMSQGISPSHAQGPPPMSATTEMATESPSLPTHPPDSTRPHLPPPHPRYDSQASPPE